MHSELKWCVSPVVLELQHLFRISREHTIKYGRVDRWITKPKNVYNNYSSDAILPLAWQLTDSRS